MSEIEAAKTRRKHMRVKPCSLGSIRSNTMGAGQSLWRTSSTTHSEICDRSTSARSINRRLDRVFGMPVKSRDQIDGAPNCIFGEDQICFGEIFRRRKEASANRIHDH